MVGRCGGTTAGVGRFAGGAARWAARSCIIAVIRFAFGELAGGVGDVGWSAMEYVNYDFMILPTRMTSKYRIVFELKMCYYSGMYNWSTDATKLAKNPEAYAVWRLEQLVNFGLGNKERISKKELVKYWKRITIDPARRKFLALLLHGH